MSEKYMINRAKKDFNKNKWIYLILFLSSVIGELLFSTTTSPLANVSLTDSMIFQTIGKFWSSDCLPYVDMFDHKGPFIFWINAVGYRLLGTRTGLFVVQILFYYASELFAFRILYPKFNRYKAATIAALLPVIQAFVWDNGNYSEEYMLPFLFVSFYLMLKWTDAVDEEEYEHKPVFAFVYGLTFAIALMIRLTNAIGVCIGVAFIAVILMINKKWKNLLCNIVAFIIGVAVVVVPFSVYFYLKGALYEMWYGTLLYNLDYAESSLGLTFTAFNIGQLIRIYVSGGFLIVASLYKFIISDGKKKIPAIMWFLIATVCTLFMCMMNVYRHYGICSLPFMYVALNQLKDCRLEAPNRKIAVALLYFVAVGGVANGVYAIAQNGIIIDPYVNHIEDRMVYDDLIDLIPEEDRDSFNAYDCPTEIYLQTNITPSGRYIFLQTWQGSHSEKLTESIHEMYDTSNTKWILVNRTEGYNLIIEDILSEKYELIDKTEDGEYELYKLSL
jgi:hypothetical protein